MNFLSIVMRFLKKLEELFHKLFAVGYCLIISKPYSSSGIFFHFLLSSLLLLYIVDQYPNWTNHEGISFFGTVSVKESIKQTKFHEDDVFYSNTYSRRKIKISKAGTKNQKTVPNMKKKRIRTCWQCCLFRLRGNNTDARSEGTIALQPLTN